MYNTFFLSKQKTLKIKSDNVHKLFLQKLKYFEMSHFFYKLLQW